MGWVLLGPFAHETQALILWVGEGKSEKVAQSEMALKALPYTRPSCVTWASPSDLHQTTLSPDLAIMMTPALQQ